MAVADIDWRSLVADTLEAARLEVVRRLTEAGYPLSLTTERVVTTDRDEDNGPQSSWVPVSVSGLHDHLAMMAIRDDTIPHQVLGLRPLLEPLATLLDQHSTLGEAQQTGLWPGLTGVNGVLVRCLHPLMLHYLLRLPDLSTGDAALLAELGSDVAAVASSDSVIRVHQLALEGILPSVPLSHAGITMRRLTPEERGALAEMHDLPSDIRADLDFVPMRPFSMFNATALLELTSTRSRSAHPDGPGQLHSVLLAFFLQGFDIGSMGFITSFDRPRWVSQGYAGSPVPVGKARVATPQPISLDEFKAVVELATRIPDFTTAETTRAAVALRRGLIGFGSASPEAGFLDFAIALEASLLAGTRDELSYRFALYGALFLRDEHQSTAVFAKLQHIYKVRSKLVHGAPVKAADRLSAATDAASLVRAILKKAASDGWPDKKLLDGLALASPSGSNRGKVGQVAEEPKQLVKGKEFERLVQADFKARSEKDAAPPLTEDIDAIRERHLVDPHTRKGRTDIWIEYDRTGDGAVFPTVIFEIKTTNWDTTPTHRLRPNILRTARQLWRYVETALGEDSQVQAFVVFPSAPDDIWLKRAVEMVFAERGIMVLWWADDSTTPVEFLDAAMEGGAAVLDLLLELADEFIVDPELIANPPTWLATVCAAGENRRAAMGRILWIETILRWLLEWGGTAAVARLDDNLELSLADVQKYLEEAQVKGLVSEHDDRRHLTDEGRTRAVELRQKFGPPPKRRQRLN